MVNRICIIGELTETETNQKQRDNQSSAENQGKKGLLRKMKSDEKQQKWDTKS